MPPILLAPIARMLVGGLMLAVFAGGAVPFGVTTGAAAQD